MYIFTSSFQVLSKSTESKKLGICHCIMNQVKPILGPQTSLGASRQLNDEGGGGGGWWGWAFFPDFLKKGS